ncbi:uncharacterized protein LOC118194436 [Stegodyphus dumicola]|uniref:uncharacterized protein LOC118194436 n=1 Tax=Stegodyphus dumicola TaxID=202533 RepID=UPI0015B3552A|nr:uncharacterized protein LOC118194436 [Stegodyphus dumicola]XP_035221487.1 uncharacterized protein LOC118194436 [Stegodyphus dumicola]XP_035221488.1 uncharacterized protein LOC118194436 [Stegodyphus dumicola]
MKFQLLPYVYLTPVLLFVVGAQFNECSINDENCTFYGRDVELYMDLLWRLESSINTTLNLPDSRWDTLKFYNGSLSQSFSESDDDCVCLLYELKDKIYVTYNLASAIDLSYSWEIASDNLKLQGSITISTEFLDMKMYLLDYRDGGYKIENVVIEQQNVYSYYSDGAFSDLLENLPEEVYNAIMKGPLKRLMEKTLLKAFSERLKDLYRGRNRTSNNLI